VISPTFISFHFLPSIFKFLGIEMVHEDKSPFSVDHVNLNFFFFGRLHGRCDYSTNQCCHTVMHNRDMFQDLSYFVCHQHFFFFFFLSVSRSLHCTYEVYRLVLGGNAMRV
jgi:hypothetical protein